MYIYTYICIKLQSSTTQYKLQIYEVQVYVILKLQSSTSYTVQVTNLERSK